ncbi:hypothetical protein HYQ44_000926 [Verticillium longisporum]|nr:hypothetical protein HYQ44_000926 [Verticillium longisporum]
MNQALQFWRVGLLTSPHKDPERLRYRAHLCFKLMQPYFASKHFHLHRWGFPGFLTYLFMLLSASTRKVDSSC